MPAQAIKPRCLRRHQILGASLPQNELHTACKIRLVLSSVQLIYHAHATHLLGPSRGGRNLAGARQTMHYLAHCCFSISYSELARLTGRDRTTVAHACRRVEDSRDDPRIDKGLYFLESSLTSMALMNLRTPYHFGGADDDSSG